MRSRFLLPHQWEFCGALSSAGVRYLVIGGKAVQYHGYWRDTGNLDLLLDPAEDNRTRFHQLLEPLMTPGLATAVQTGWHSVSTPGLKTLIYGDVDFRLRSAGLDFEAAYRVRDVVCENGTEVHVISLAHLLQNKRTVGREKDLMDIEELQQLHPDEGRWCP